MCKILDEFCRGFLDGRAEKVEDKAAFKNDLKTIRDVAATVEERKAAEGRVWEEVRQQGGLMIHGDLLTLERIECAKKARSRSVTNIEDLSFVKCTILGPFHLGAYVLHCNAIQRRDVTTSRNSGFRPNSGGLPYLPEKRPEIREETHTS